jgi:hypothetical protein
MKPARTLPLFATCLLLAAIPTYPASPEISDHTAAEAKMDSLKRPTRRNRFARREDRGMPAVTGDHLAQKHEFPGSPAM